MQPLYSIHPYQSPQKLRYQICRFSLPELSTVAQEDADNKRSNFLRKDLQTCCIYKTLMHQPIYPWSPLQKRCRCLLVIQYSEITHDVTMPKLLSLFKVHTMCVLLLLQVFNLFVQDEKSWTDCFSSVCLNYILAP